MTPFNSGPFSSTQVSASSWCSRLIQYLRPDTGDSVFEAFQEYLAAEGLREACSSFHSLAPTSRDISGSAEPSSIAITSPNAVGVSAPPLSAPPVTAALAPLPPPIVSADLPPLHPSPPAAANGASSSSLPASSIDNSDLVPSVLSKSPSLLSKTSASNEQQRAATDSAPLLAPDELYDHAVVPYGGMRCQDAVAAFFGLSETFAPMGKLRWWFLSDHHIELTTRFLFQFCSDGTKRFADQLFRAGLAILFRFL